MTRDQKALLEDKLSVWRRDAERGPVDYRDYHRRAVDALEAPFNLADDYRERLHDLVMIDAEEWAIGGGPGFRERKEKAWSRAREMFEP